MIFPPQVVRARARTRCILCLSRDAQFTAPGLPGGREGCGQEARTGGRLGAHPSRRPSREALAARARSDASRLRPPVPARPCVAVAREGRGREAGLSPASPWGRGNGLGHRGRDKPGVLTPSPGPLLPRDRMLAAQAGRADGSQTQLGEGRTRPWVGLGWGAAESRLRGFRPGPRGAGGCRDPGQAAEPSSPSGRVHPKHRLQEAAYQRGCPMSSALSPLRAETCVSMTLSLRPAGVGWGAARPDPITQAQRVSRVARPWPRALPGRPSRHEHCFPSCALWAGSSGPLRPQKPVVQAFAYQRVTQAG